MQEDQHSIKHMIESSPAYIKCFQCKKSPKQFTFLLCNHIICQKCISKNIQISQKYNLVKCSCGCITYFNEDNQILQQKQKSLTKLKITQQQNQNLSKIKKLSLQKKNLPKSQQTIGTYTKTLLNQRSTIPMLEVSQVFSLEGDDSEQYEKHQYLSPQKQRYIRGSPETHKLGSKFTGAQYTDYLQSQLLDNNQTYDLGKKTDINKQINQFSTHIIQQKKMKSPKVIKNSFSINPCKNEINLLSSNKESQRQLNHLSNLEKNQPVHLRFQNEINFMKILFHKDIEEINFQFKKIIEDLQKKFTKFQQTLRSLYAQEVIAKDSIFSHQFSQLIKEKYQTTIGKILKNLKNQLFFPFSNFKHNQNLLSYQSPVDSPIVYMSYQNSKPRTPRNNSINLSRSDQDSEEQSEQKRKNKKVQKFETVAQKLSRLTTKQNEYKLKKKVGQMKFLKQNNNKRIQTQNTHTSIRRLHDEAQDQKQNYNGQNLIQRYKCPQVYDRLTQKPERQITQTEPLNLNKKHRQFIYFSPSLGYCSKHLEKRRKEEKNYISYIEKLCHQKKMKNNHELFKRVRQGNQLYQFRNRL